VGGCDQGSPRDEPPGTIGVPVLPIKLVSANVGPTQGLPANGRIELGFDRLLLPASISRQTFLLEDAAGVKDLEPTIAYDPVARIVTITPLPDTQFKLVAGQTYEIVIFAPQSPGDVNGLRAIDGATLEAPSPRRIAFAVTAAAAPPATVSIDFCRDIYPLTSVKCSLSVCHGAGAMGNYPAAGLLLDPPSGIDQTAVGRVAQGSNTGPQAAAQPPTLLFAEDMPVIDPNGDSANSWLMYKVLLAAPSAEMVDAATTPVGASDAGPDATLSSGVDASMADAGDDGDPGTDAGPIDGGSEGAEGGVAEGGSAGADAGPTDAGNPDAEAPDSGTTTPATVPPIDVSGAHALAWTGITDAERITLSNYILGREMPFPPPTSVRPSFSTDPLTLDELERVSLWIAQGAAAPTSCSTP
jgi:hypothetical protein